MRITSKGQVTGLLLVNPVIYAEVSIGFRGVESCDEALSAHLIERDPIPWPASFLAGKAFAEYRRRGGSRKSTLPDFFIGAHAAVRSVRLLTRDASRYRTYFPALELIAPAWLRVGPPAPAGGPLSAAGPSGGRSAPR